jgi:uncharacterized protein (DUF924 family)
MASMEAVLDFWFGAPAEQPETLMRKMYGWFAGTPKTDDEIRLRFEHRVEQAVRGELDYWGISVQGRLALVLLLDQMTRILWRGTARAWDGDLRAQRLAKEAFDVRAHVGLRPIEQLFLAMPFAHAEDPALQAQALTLSRRAIRQAPAWQQVILTAEFVDPVEYRLAFTTHGKRFAS